LQPTTHLSTPNDENRPSWSGWLAYREQFTYKSGHPSAAGRVQDMESLSVKDRCATTVPSNQLLYYQW